MNEPENDVMTSSQRDAICKAYSMLGEHFDRVLIVVDFECATGENGELEDAHEGYWKGGSLSAIGMAEYAKHRILESGRKQQNEP